MGDVKIKLNISGINEIMKGADVQAIVHEQAQLVAGRAGEGFGVSDVPHKWFARSFVSVDPNQPIGVRERAYARQRRDAVLERAVFGA